MTQSPHFGIVVGEQSGDNLGAGLMQALLERYPGAKFTGIGGSKMEALGCRSLAPMERLAVMGFVEPLGRLPELLRIKKQLEKHFIENKPDAYIGIDAPDFNLRVEANLRLAGIKTVHYVSPSVWAYRAGRIHKIKQAVDLMLTLFPFETAIYREHKVSVHCVGHPLADSIDFTDRQQSFRERFGLQADACVVTLMPGSRSGEIKRLGPDFIGAAVAALQQRPELQFLIPCVNGDARQQVQDSLRSEGILPGPQFQLVDDSHGAISAADLVLLASGTATLETMLLGRPMIVCYKLAALTYMLASRMVKIPHVALPNLLAGRELVPEYIQHAVKPQTLADEILRGLEGGEEQQAMLAEFRVMHEKLRCDASVEAATAISELLSGASA